MWAHVECAAYMCCVESQVSGARACCTKESFILIYTVSSRVLVQRRWYGQAFRHMHCSNCALVSGRAARLNHQPAGNVCVSAFQANTEDYRCQQQQVACARVHALKGPCTVLLWLLHYAAYQLSTRLTSCRFTHR